MLSWIRLEPGEHFGKEMPARLPVVGRGRTRIRQRAAIVDEGAAALLILTPAAALASLVAVVIELGHAPSLSQNALAISTIVLSWAFMHSIFALHYAHEFYGEGRDDRMGGLIFPGKDKPDYWELLLRRRSN
jgi:uncharacterized membrane protein